MSDKMRWRYGEKNEVEAAVDAAIVIEIGDLVYQDIDSAKPASALPDAAKGVNAGRFADNFLGVAMQRSRPGDTDPICVATTGVFEFDCPMSPWELGDCVGVSAPLRKDGSLDPGALNKLANQTVVGTPSGAIARVANRTLTPTTSVLVDIRSTVMTGGITQRIESAAG